MYFSARAEGRISYGHLGRTNSCYFFSFVVAVVFILYLRRNGEVPRSLDVLSFSDVDVDVDIDVERKQAQAIASLPDSITQLLCLL